jgi:hypothetical protein
MQNRNTAVELILSKLMAAIQLTTVHFQITFKTHTDLQFSSLTLVINMTYIYLLE